jgi:hypothetical protein
MNAAYGFNPLSVYDQDDRYELKDADQSIRLLGKSVAGMVELTSVESINVNGVDKIRILTSQNGDWDIFCDDIPFYGQLIAPNCTGFLIGENLLMTAGHCAKDVEKSCLENIWAFGIEDYKTDPTKQYIDLDLSEVATCEKVLSVSIDPVGLDYAIIQLKGAEKIPSLKIRSNNEKISSNDKVFSIGHPRGTPLKVADNGSIHSNVHESFFTTDLDTFKGNSGSPVFNKTSYEVEGILVRGNDDFYWDGARGCFYLAKYNDENAGTYEGVVRIRSIPEINGLLKNQ